jgi:hypothetical protein
MTRPAAMAAPTPAIPINQETMMLPARLGMGR